MHSDLVISQADRRPMYLQIMEQIRRRIAVGDWPPGHEIPSIRALAAAVQVSVITVKRAYLELEREGAIVTRQGKGSFVADHAGLSAQLRRGELDAHLSAAVDLGHQLGLTPQDIEQRLRDLQAARTEPDDRGRTDAGDATGSAEPTTGRSKKDEQER
jgi:GntR family transcriptional regulator